MPKVLIVDDNEDMLDTLDHLFRFYEFEVAKAENGKIGIKIAESDEPDIIILDALMPVLNGFEACKILKENPRTKDIPVIFLSANYVEDEHRIMGIELGADDYILKPFNAKELIARVKSILHKKELVESLKVNNRNLIREKTDANKKIEKLQKKTVELEGTQITDALTGLYNRTFFEKRFHEEFSRTKRYKDALSLVMVDVDLFRTVNDMFGEKTGDYILMRIANVILNNTRTTDVVFRLEGNRFAILLPKTDESGAYYEAERIRSEIAQTAFFDQDFYELKKLSSKRKQEAQKLTVSVGLMEVDPTQTEKPEYYQNQVIRALQQAKAEGRNKTVRFSRLSEPT